MRLSQDELYVVATDSATAQPAYGKSGPLGTYGEGYPFTFFGDGRSCLCGLMSTACCASMTL